LAFDTTAVVLFIWAPSALDLANSRYRVEHAKGHVQDFKTEVIAFNQSHPYAAVCEPSADGTEDLYKAKLVKPMPVRLPGIAFDIVSGLRSALDLAGYSAAIAGGKSEASGTRIRAGFPFRDFLSEIEGARTGESKDIPKEIFDVMVSFKPYKGGNDLLWALNKLTNTEKHRIVVPANVATGATSIRHFEVTGDSVLNEARFGVGFWDSGKNELIWARMKRGGKLNADIKFRGFIAMGDVEGIVGKPAFPILNGFVAEVTTILDAIEAEATRIRLGA
jgi:hypothetical protein